MPKYYHPQSSFFKSYNMPAPEATTHGSIDDIKKNLTKLKPTSWHMEGNKLVGETEMGSLINYLPTDVICKGTDENGLPILEKIVS